MTHGRRRRMVIFFLPPWKKWSYGIERGKEQREFAEKKESQSKQRK